MYREYTTSQTQCQYLIRKYFWLFFEKSNLKKEAIVNRADANGQTAITGAWGTAPTRIKTCGVANSKIAGFVRLCPQTHYSQLLYQIWCNSRKQCLWRAICEKRSFPPRRICVFSACWGSAPNPGEQELFWVTLPSGHRLRNWELLSLDQTVICKPGIISVMFTIVIILWRILRR